MDRPARECADKLIGRKARPETDIPVQTDGSSNRRSLIALAGPTHVFAVVILDLLPDSNDKSKIITPCSWADADSRRRLKPPQSVRDVKTRMAGA